MKVFIFGLRGFPNVQGGVEIHSEYLYTTLKKSNLNFTVFRRTPYLSQSSKDAIYPHINFIDLPSSKIKGIEALFHSFLSAVVTIIKKPDIVHVHNIGPGFFILLLKLFKLKVVLTYHSPNYEHKKWNKLSKFFLKISELISLKFSDRIIFVSEKQQNKFPYVKNKSVCIPNGVLKPILSIENESSYLKKYLLEPKNYILYVGRITPEKGVDTLINAYLMSEIKTKLIIAGVADNQTKYAAEINRLTATHYPNIIFTGFISGLELACIYKNAKLFVLPSFNEGNPIALLEAMSYNLNVIVSDIPANKEVGLDDSCYFEVGNVSSLSDKIIQNIQNSEYTSYTHLLDSKYNWEKIAIQTLSVYDSLFEERDC